MLAIGETLIGPDARAIEPLEAGVNWPLLVRVDKTSPHWFPGEWRSMRRDKRRAKWVDDLAPNELSQEACSQWVEYAIGEVDELLEWEECSQTSNALGTDEMGMVLESAAQTRVVQADALEQLLRGREVELDYEAESNSENTSHPRQDIENIRQQLVGLRESILAASTETSSADTAGETEAQQSAANGESEQVVGGSTARHSVDFASVNWHGTLYRFTATQAACVRVLWEAWQNATPIVGESAIQENAETKSAMRSLFAGHPAWGTLIESPSKGRFQIKEPISE